MAGPLAAAVVAVAVRMEPQAPPEAQGASKEATAAAAAVVAVAAPLVKAASVMLPAEQGRQGIKATLGLSGDFMWVINQRGKVEIRSNNIEQNISSVLAQDFPEAEIYVSLENCINQVNSTLFQTVEKEGEPIEFEQVLQDENGEPVLDAAGEKVLEKFTAPGPSIVESAGNTLAMEGSCLLVCDKNENELGRWALRLVRTGLG